MSRPLRIEYRDAWYHVMNRGRRAENIFLDDADYRSFFKVLSESVALFGVHVCGYCLMPNHYHLLVQTPEANLSRFMRHVNGLYTQRFNRHHRIDGPLFRGRFKSILIGDEGYLVELLRYICFNPVKANIVSKPEEYPWSCYLDYLSIQKQQDWLNRDLLLSRFTLKKQKGKTSFDLLSTDASEAMYTFFAKKNLPSLLGPREFIDRIRNGFFPKMVHPEIPATKELAYDPEKIITIVCSAFKIDKSCLFQQKRGLFNAPRDVAIALVRTHTRLPLADIGALFQIANYSSVSSIIERMKKRLVNDLNLMQHYRRIEQQLST